MKTKPRKRKKLTDAFLNKLPLWKLLTIAMRDLKKQEKAPNSVVDMDDWLVRNGQCKACMAGSVMRFSCGVRGSRRSNDYVWETPNWALAVNEMRCGQVGDALNWLGRGEFRVRHKLNCIITPYNRDHVLFWRGITRLRDDLKKAGL